LTLEQFDKTQKRASVKDNSLLFVKITHRNVFDVYKELNQPKKQGNKV